MIGDQYSAILLNFFLLCSVCECPWGGVGVLGFASLAWWSLWVKISHVKSLESAQLTWSSFCLFSHASCAQCPWGGVVCRVLPIW